MTDRIVVSIRIDAPASKIWSALTDPQLVRAYMMGATLATDWQVGHPMTWSGRHDGKSFEDRGTVRVFEPQKRLTVTHWSPLLGRPDIPENRHLVSYELEPAGGGTRVTLTHENLTGVSEAQSRKNWQPVLDGLKQTAENR